MKKLGLGRGLSKLLEQADVNISPETQKSIDLSECLKRNAVRRAIEERDEYWNNKMWEFGQWHNEQIKEKESNIDTYKYYTISESAKILNLSARQVQKKCTTIGMKKTNNKYYVYGWILEMWFFNERLPFNEIFRKPKIKERPKRRLQKTYLMKDDASGLYKIGKSVNTKFREKTLQSEKPSIKTVKIWEINIESKLHNDYAEFRKRGEWFELSKAQVTFMCTNYK